jgi:hypothetical protein
MTCPFADVTYLDLGAQIGGAKTARLFLPVQYALVHRQGSGHARPRTAT